MTCKVLIVDGVTSFSYFFSPSLLFQFFTLSNNLFSIKIINKDVCMSLRLPLVFLQNFSFVLFCFFALSACDFNSSSSSEREKGNPISIMGVDGPMAGADVEVYDLQAYLDNSDTAPSLLYRPAITNPVTALADDLELQLDAGLGPYLVVVTANSTTIDLTTGPIGASMFIILKELQLNSKRRALV